MRPQHDGHDGRPSPQSQSDAESDTTPIVPRARSGDTSTFDRVGRIRQDRPEGKSGRHRLDSSASRAASRALPAVPEPLALPAIEPWPADVARPADVAGPAEPALPAVLEMPELPALRAATLTPEHLPVPPQELSLARRDSVVPRQATPRPSPWWDLAQPAPAPAAQPRHGVEESWGWASPPPPSYPLPTWEAPEDALSTWDAEDVWDSTEERPAFSWGLTGEIARIPRPALPLALDKTALSDEVATLASKPDVERFLTPAGPLTPGMGPVRALHGTVKVARFAALGLIALLGIAAVVSQPNGPNPPTELSETSQSVLDQRASSAADRSLARSAAPSPSGASAAAQAKASPKASATAKATPKATSTKVAPVAGLDQAQMTNAQTIVRTGQKLGIPSRGLLISLMTAMQESNLYNLASQAVPESFNYPHQGNGMDYDSCGLFQQRTSMGWGTVEQIMDPVYSSTKFFRGLLQVGGWQNMELTLAAQAVQGSAFPYAYAKHEGRARSVLNALT